VGSTGVRASRFVFSNSPLGDTNLDSPPFPLLAGFLSCCCFNLSCPELP